MKATLYFAECEHDGDLNTYKSDLIASGASILKSSLDTEEETCTITIEADDIESFSKRFRETESSEMVIN